MLKELNRNYLPEDQMAFIGQDYPVRADDIQKIIADAKRNETKYISAHSYLYNQIGSESEDIGVDNLRPLLEAVRILEFELPESQRILTPEKYLNFLLVGEVTSAKKVAESKGKEPAANLPIHLTRAIKLAGFLNKKK